MYKSIKTMRQALDEARAYRDPIDEMGNVQQAIQIAKKLGGNMTAAINQIEKIAKGLSDEPSVQAALRTANESRDLEEFTRHGGGEVRYDNQKGGWFNKAGKRIYLGKVDTMKLVSKDIEKKIRTGDWITPADLSKEENEKTI